MLMRPLLPLVFVAGILGGCCTAADPLVKTLYRLQTGSSLGERGELIRPDSLENVVLIASFAHDYGYFLRAVMVDCTIHGRTEAAAEKIMSRWNWSSLSNDRRIQQAEVLVKDLFHKVNPDVVPSERTAFTFEDTPSYHPIQTSVQDDETLIVRVWTRKPPGMINVFAYIRFEYEFRPEGTVSREKVEQFSVPGDRVAKAREQ